MIKGLRSIYEDFISRLPDEVLISIISLLTMEEAVRTCVLSQRWKYLWRYFTGCLKFDIYSLSKHYLVPEDPIIRSEWFVTWVNTVLNAYKGEIVHELKIHHIIEDPLYEFDMDGWISFARKKHVQKLSLNLGCLYKFPKICCISNFDSLRFLSLEGVDGSNVEHVFSTCPLLEVLKLNDVRLLKGNFRVSGSFLMLKFLELKDCSIERLEVSAPNLTTLICNRSAKCIVLLETQKLLKLSLTGMHIGEYRVLHGGVPFQDPDSIYKTFFISLLSPLSLTNVKRLDLKLSSGQCAFSCISVISSAPSLREFSIELPQKSWYDCQESPMDTSKITNMVAKEVGNARHEKLENVVVQRFDGNEFGVDLILGLVIYAVHLKKLSIVVNSWLLWEQVSAKMTLKKWAKLQVERLRTKLPPTIQLEMPDHCYFFWEHMYL